MNISLRNTAVPMRRGFTLIELLVVVAIIALLAAILFPAFERAEENSMRTTCQSNMKQIALATIQYLQDNDGIYPRIGGTGNNSNGNVGTCGGAGGTKFTGNPTSWPEAIMPYVGTSGSNTDTTVWLCPADKTLISLPNTTLDYGENWFLGLYKGAEVGVFPACPEAQVNQPAVTIMWYEDREGNGGETVQCDDYSSYFDENYNTISSNVSQYTAPAGYPHLETGANWAFCDGHVKFFANYTCYTGCSGGSYASPYNYNPETCVAQDGMTWLPSY